jgi:hypothetical protein
MGIIEKLFHRKANPKMDEVAAFPITFSGKGVYQKSFGKEFGVVLEDDGKTGYLYATNGGHTEIYDALQVYNGKMPDAISNGERVFIVWNPIRKRAGLYFRGRFAAIFDFALHRGICRSGCPSSSMKWPGQHVWDEELVDGLQLK